MPSIIEAEAITNLMKEFPGQAIGISFSCRDGAHPLYHSAGSARDDTPPGGVQGDEGAVLLSRFLAGCAS